MSAPTGEVVRPAMELIERSKWVPVPEVPLSELAARVEAVLELHVPVKHWRGMGHDIEACRECGIEAGWPCPTVRLLNGERE